jgi:tRNA-2-methylthio-N6-dimethylallyladenosine synthase
MNEHDSERMAGVLEVQGMRPAGSESDADVILLNTCAVREKASEKVFARLGALRELKQRRPDLILGVCGCVAQLQQEAIFRRAGHVDFVMGPRHLGSLGRLVDQARARRRQVAVLDPRDRLLPEPPATALRASRVRALVTVMEGCNKACAFCVVPTTRGREACRPPQAVLDEAARLVEAGYLEVELLGQTVNAYRHGSWSFPRLLAAAAAIPGLRRLRYTTSHPLHFTRELARAMAESDVVCPHVHLPVQSGSDRVLARMRRGYTREDYLARVAEAREILPGLAVSTDVIVGFPGETEADFEATLDLLRGARFDQVYAFTYSPRPGTPAAGWSDDVPPREKDDRLQRLFAIQRELQRERNAAHVGRVEEVLAEGPSLTDPSLLSGRTRTGKVVNFSGPPAAAGRLVSVRIASATAHSLRGAVENGADGAAAPYP